MPSFGSARRLMSKKKQKKLDLASKRKPDPSTETQAAETAYVDALSDAWHHPDVLDVRRAMPPLINSALIQHVVFTNPAHYALFTKALGRVLPAAASPKTRKRTFRGARIFSADDVSGLGLALLPPPQQQPAAEESEEQSESGTDLLDMLELFDASAEFEHTLGIAPGQDRDGARENAEAEAEVDTSASAYSDPPSPEAHLRLLTEDASPTPPPASPTPSPSSSEPGFQIRDDSLSVDGGPYFFTTPDGTIIEERSAWSDDSDEDEEVRTPTTPAASANANVEASATPKAPALLPPMECFEMEEALQKPAGIGKWMGRVLSASVSLRMMQGGRARSRLRVGRSVSA